jgi:hypothetical protein
VIKNRKIANAEYLFLDSLHVITHFVLAVVALYEEDRQCASSSSVMELGHLLTRGKVRTYNVLKLRRVRVTIIAVEKHNVLNTASVCIFCLTYPQVSSKVCRNSFCQLENSVSLPWVIYYEAFYLHVVSSFSCIPVICPKLLLFLIPM